MAWSIASTHRFSCWCFVDVLDDFNGLSTKDKKESTAPATKKTTVTEEPSGGEQGSLDDMLDNDAFAKQLQAGMEELMGNMDQDPEMKAAFEKVWGSFDPATMAAQANEEAAKNSSSTARGPAAGASFQDTIDQTMNKLKDSSKQVDVSWH